MKSPLYVAIPLVATLGLTACMNTYDPNTKATQGAVMGAALGGIAAAATSSDNDKLAKTAVGAMIGGAIGGAIGQRLDQQAADLRQDLGNGDVKIVNTGSQLIVTMPQDILFATDSAVVVPSLQDDLRALAYNLQDYPNTTVQIIGHTDNTGSATYNQELSTRRASAVATILRANGVASGRIQAFGRGEDAPIATNLTPDGRAQNRRVEIVITPMT
ncbi:OmpA family protein [Celeribacter persicus]|jgi:Outer membrane protein and related peptidoglycan-associated (lipo)proteins|uniref:Outer membrane protein OmpA-like peptidoglycan-associated protein n=1 Tax=Celeribacter persicus TaxID=1651082 RepID=A0A2T5HWH7_9RHOB|nr:OmpA family protein [Celeribacter persicus]PTQ75942.1 outer membrane protein OmpA-like peptidoglycan-associated protein [Celeribacter persicus]